MSLLEIYLHAQCKCTPLSQVTGIDALIHHLVADAEFGIAAQIFCQCEEVGGLCPYRHALQPAEVSRNLISETQGLQSQVRAILNPAVAETVVAQRIAYTARGISVT